VCTRAWKISHGSNRGTLAEEKDYFRITAGTNNNMVEAGCMDMEHHLLLYLDVTVQRHDLCPAPLLTKTKKV
jgi:hypothetical protein